MAGVAVSDQVVIEYETFGDPSDPAVLLVTGFGAQLIAWDEGLCSMFADGGRFVIRYDNRDCGLSTKWTGTPNLAAIIGAASQGRFDLARELAPYTLSDLAIDGLGLLSALGVERAHVVGASMGGMIAQVMAIEHPERVITLTSMMASTGEPDVGQSTPEALQVLLAPPPADRASAIERADATLVWCSKRYADPAELRDNAARSFDRCHCPEGNARQLAALLAHGPTVDGLRRLDTPTLVIHGLDDTLVTPSGGQRVAEVTPGARLVMMQDMGHDRPRPLWPRLAAEILAHTAPTLP